MLTPEAHNFITTPFQSATLVDLLRWRAQHQPEGPGWLTKLSLL